MPAPAPVRPHDHTVDPDGREDLSLAPVGRNLLTIPLVRRALRSRWYPGILQLPVAAVFGLVAYQLLLGPDAAHDNPGTALMWVLWWPLIPIVFVLVGRFWCAVCPFGALSDLVQKLVGAQRPVPVFLKKYGIWIIDASFLIITWSDHVWGVVESPWGSGVLLLILTTLVIASGAFYQRRTFCRYLCFLGGMAGNYARVGMVELRADSAICKTCTARAVCYNGNDKVAGCPLFSFPRTMDDSANCNLCANCIKSCPNDAIELRVRKPASELWFIRKPQLEQSFLAAAIMGIVLIQNVTMLEVWQDVLDAIERTTGVTSYPVIFTAAFVIAVGLPVALLAGASRLAAARNLESTRMNFARFGYALIPLDVAAHIAHNLFHLLAEGKSVYYTLTALLGGQSDGGSTALVSTGTIQVLQFVLLAVGIVGSLYTARRIAHRRYQTAARRRTTLAPYVAIIGLLGALNVYFFLLPMAMRM
ncbi:4Fe-4S binding protein [Pengzhenrongella frigida]|uniref:4Fe-4S binding protein n=1 Tax=Pengzhenrongella frigida TaxID=1259133 RepID=A0A4Q5N6Z7_9MICO|nr:4Fe-4S binding protein [Cellulomonas sp. HLT2-17]RYV52151.1 4Fe-4S binding protein [Cellulomonas sp. HLT2-17]